MKKIREHFIFLALITVAALSFVVAKAQSLPEVSLPELLDQLLKAIALFKMSGIYVGISAVVMLLVASMKNSILRTYVWDKLGGAKVLVAPALSLIAIALETGSLGLKEMLAAIMTGAGAVALHEFLDALKSMPGIGPMYVKVIDVIGLLLLKKAEPKPLK